jgi:hypothetical protein
MTSLLATGMMGEIFMAAEPIPKRQPEVKDRGASLLGGSRCMLGRRGLQVREWRRACRAWELLVANHV